MMWKAFNEPQVFIMSAYVIGNFAPFRHDVFTFRSHHLCNMLLCHGKAVQIIRDSAKKVPKIGIAMASTTYIPNSETPEGLEEARRNFFETQVGEGSNSLYMDSIMRILSALTAERYKASRLMKQVRQFAPN